MGEGDRRLDYIAIRLLARIYPRYLFVWALAVVSGLLNIGPNFRSILEAKGGPWSAALILFVLVLSVPNLRRGFAGRRVAAVGASSYSIYMMHPLAIALAVYLRAPFLVVPAALLLTVGMALFSYRFIEQPGIRLGRNLAVRRFFRAPTATALT